MGNEYEDCNVINEKTGEKYASMWTLTDTIGFLDFNGHDYNHPEILKDVRGAIRIWGIWKYGVDLLEKDPSKARYDLSEKEINLAKALDGYITEYFEKDLKKSRSQLALINYMISREEQSTYEDVVNFLKEKGREMEMSKEEWEAGKKKLLSEMEAYRRTLEDELAEN